MHVVAFNLLNSQPLDHWLFLKFSFEVANVKGKFNQEISLLLIFAICTYFFLKFSDTFDVQDVDYILSPGKVCVSCSYLSLSPARGCVLVISELGVNSDIELYTNISIDVIEGCVFVTRGGRYRLRVFDWEFDDRRGVKPIINVIVSIEDPLPVVEPCELIRLPLSGMVIGNIQMSIGYIFIIIMTMYLHLHELTC